MINILIVFILTTLILFIILILIKNNLNKKIEYYISFIENLIEKNEWVIYKYRFLKKLIYIQYFYNIKFENKEDLISVVENSEMFKQDIGLSYPMFFDYNMIQKINTVIEENKMFFDNMFINDNYINENEIIIKNLTDLLSELKKSRIDY
jgi:bifunctional N-acetylglucosamine-1-phosphate-uridyltransferase/glucosamine-1-phosphate-acetyltransferase GlmU-like protein